QVQAASTGSGEATAADLAARLSALDRMVSTALGAAGATARAEAIDLDLERRVTQQDVVAGVTVPELLRARRQLSSLLDVVDARGDERLRARTAVLRRELAALTFGQSDDELRRQR